MSARGSGKLARRIVLGIIVAAVLLVAGCAWYVGDYHHASDAVWVALADDAADEVDGIEVRDLGGKALAFVPPDPQAGLVFYPGAKVQPEAYAPLMRRCAERGVLCVLVKPLFNLAILDADAAGGLTAQCPETDRWMIGGHSMGGVAAADYLSRHEGDFGGVVFVASYPATDLSGFDGWALSVVGDEDGVLNRSAYEAAKSALPARFREEAIEGANHANFGDYGDQPGDGQATIEREIQQARTADAIASLAAQL